MYQSTVQDPYCNFCGDSEDKLLDTHDRKSICVECAIAYLFCENCGSMPAYEGQPASEQLHYDEECFK